MTPKYSSAFSCESQKIVVKLIGNILDQKDNLLDSVNGVEAIHESRVSVNKLRVALTLFSVLPKKTAKQLQGELEWLKDGLASVRDCDVILDLIGTLGDPPYDNDRPGIEAVLNALQNERAQHLQDLNALVAQSRFPQLLSDLDAVRQKLKKSRRKASAADPDEAQLLEENLAGLIKPLYEKFEKRRKALSDSFDSTSMHSLRISAKKLRYALDFFKNLKPDLYPALSESLHELHDCTGNLHDIDVLWPKIEQLSAHWKMTLAPEESGRLETGVEWLLFRLYTKRRELMRQFYGIWAVTVSEDFQSRLRTAAGQ